MKHKFKIYLHLSALAIFFLALGCQEKYIDETYIASQLSRFCDMSHVTPAACKCARSELKQLDADILLLYAKEGHYRKKNEKVIKERNISSYQVYKHIGVLDMRSVDIISKYIVVNRKYIDRKCGVHSSYFFLLIRGEEF